MTAAPKPKKASRATRPAADKATAPLGRYLRKFTLQNVRTFRSPVTLDFCHPDGTVAQWTVILGENGTGKTTLLQYLAGMMPTPLQEPSRQTKLGKYRPLIPLISFDKMALSLANLPKSLKRTEPFRMEFNLECSGPSCDFPDTAKLEGRYKLDFYLQVETNEFELPAAPRRTDKYALEIASSLIQFRLFGYGANRHIAGSASPYLSGDSFFQNGGDDPTNTLYHDDYPLISPEQWLLSLHHTYRNGETSAKKAGIALESAQRCFTNTLPDVHALAVKAQPAARGQSVMTLMCQTPYGEVPFSALSVGYRTMAAWLTDFVKRMHESFPALDEPNTGPAVVLIDEFDLHMHPKWQREAMAALSKEFPNTQFIVTAHSPLIVQATEGNAKLIVLRRFKREDGTEEVLVDDHPRYAAGWRVDQILSSDLYDLDPRSTKYDALMEESIRLRQKERLTSKEEKRLHEIETDLERNAPPGTSSASRQLFEDLERALKKAHANEK